MSQLTIFDQINSPDREFLDRWEKVRESENLAKYCRKVKFDFERAWRLIYKNGNK